MNQIAKREPDLRALIQQPSTLARLGQALPKHLTAENFAAIVLTVVSKTPDLAKCTPASFMSSVVQAAELGLSLQNGLGLAYLIPFHNSKTQETICNFIPGYRGLIELAHRTGNVRKLEATLVYDGDEFAVKRGLAPDIHHIPCGEDREVAITHVYAFVIFKDGTSQFEVMTRKQVDAIRDRGRRNPVWNSDYGEMTRKTAIRRLCKHIPLSPEMAKAMAIDAETDELLALPARLDPAKYAALTQADADEQAAHASAQEAAVEAQLSRDEKA
jgi:recombination protein RecT